MPVIKIGLVTDTHVSNRKPRYRTDESWLDTTLGKFERVLSTCKTQGTDVLLHAGDVFDSWREDPEVLIGLHDLLVKYDVPMLVAPGQHDMRDKNTESCKEDSYTGMLARTGACEVLQHGEYADVGGVRVYGFGFGEVETEKLLDGSFDHLAGEGLPFAKIALVHAEVDATNVSRSVCRGMNFVHYGDQHFGWDPEYVNPKATGKIKPVHIGLGALVRKTVDEADRRPGFAILKLSTDKDRTKLLEWALERHSVRALPPLHSFDLERREKQRSDAGKQWAAVLTRKGLAEDKTPRQIVEEVAERTGYSERAVKLVLEALDVAS